MPDQSVGMAEFEAIAKPLYYVTDLVFKLCHTRKGEILTLEPLWPHLLLEASSSSINTNRSTLEMYALVQLAT